MARVVFFPEPRGDGQLLQRTAGLPEQVIESVGVLAAELKAVAKIAGGRLNQTTALRVNFPGRTYRVTLLDVDLELCSSEAARNLTLSLTNAFSESL